MLARRELRCQRRSTYDPRCMRAGRSRIFSIGQRRTTLIVDLVSFLKEICRACVDSHLSIPKARHSLILCLWFLFRESSHTRPIPFRVCLALRNITIGAIFIGSFDWDLRFSIRACFLSRFSPI